MTVLFLIAQKDFNDTEFREPKSILEKAGIQVVVASHSTELATGVGGMRTKPNMSFSEALRRVDEFEAIVIIGGPGCTSIMVNNYALKIVQQAKADGKIISAICWGPRTLARAGVLNDRKATVNSDDPNSEVVKELEAHGGKFVKAPVVVDGNIITAFGPQFAKEFGEALLKKLRQ